MNTSNNLCISSIMNAQTLALALAPGKDTIINSDFIECSYVMEPNHGIPNCPICMDDIGYERNICVTECGHMFCMKCMALNLVMQNISCPCCRFVLADVSLGNDDDEDDDDENDDEDENEPRVEGQDTGNEVRRRHRNMYYDEDVLTINSFSTNENNNDNDHASVEEITQKLQESGLTMLDIVSVLFNRFSRIDDTYTAEYCEDMEENVYRIARELDAEKASETGEMEIMLYHDPIRIRNIELHV